MPVDKWNPIHEIENDLFIKEALEGQRPSSFDSRRARKRIKAVEQAREYFHTPEGVIKFYHFLSSLSHELEANNPLGLFSDNGSSIAWIALTFEDSEAIYTYVNGYSNKGSLWNRLQHNRRCHIYQKVAEKIRTGQINGVILTICNQDGQGPMCLGGSLMTLVSLA